MDGTIIGQGTFLANSTNSGAIAAASPTIIQIPSNADWVKVSNFTQWGTAGTNAATFQGTSNAAVGIEFYWQRGMAAGTGIVTYKGNAAATMLGDTLVSGGFTLYDPSGQSTGALPLLGNAVATTASTNAVRPVVSTATTTDLVAGTTVVRMSGTAQNDVNGIDMVVGAVTAGVSFTLLTATNALATAPGAIGGAGFYRIVNTDQLFYPRRRFVTNVTRAVNAQVSTSVFHQYVPGQLVRFEIPVLAPAAGMTQLNNLTATVLTVVDDFNFTINIDTTAFTAFAWPTIAQQPSSFPIVVPVGEDTASALTIAASQVPSMLGQPLFNVNSGILSDSTVNTGYLGMILGSGGNGLELTTPIVGPAGSCASSVPDRMYWVAGKSTYGGL